MFCVFSVLRQIRLWWSHTVTVHPNNLNMLKLQPTRWNCLNGSSASFDLFDYLLHDLFSTHNSFHSEESDSHTKKKKPKQSQTRSTVEVVLVVNNASYISCDPIKITVLILVILWFICPGTISWNISLTTHVSKLFFLKLWILVGKCICLHMFL